MRRATVLLIGGMTIAALLLLKSRNIPTALADRLGAGGVQYGSNGFEEVKVEAKVDGVPTAPGERGNGFVSAGLDDGSTTLDMITAPVDAMLIRNGSASIEVKSLDPAIGAVRALAGQMGGYIANTNIRAGDDRTRTASIELRIPNDRFDAAVSGLNGLGKVESVDVTTEDVGEQYADLEARVTNAHRLEDRLADVLAHRPGKLSDILELERELARVREQIERYDGRMRFLKARVSTSRITIAVHEPVPVLEKTTDSPIVSAVRLAWARFLGLVTLAIGWSGVVIPLGLIGSAAWWLARHRRRTLQPT